MKNILFPILLFSLFQSFAQSENSDSLRSSVIGTWEFVEVIDQDNNKIDTIQHGSGFEIPKGRLLVYREDGSYSKHFTPKNVDNGTQFFDYDNSSIIQRLYYEKPFGKAEQYLIDKGHATKDKNGDYYVIITDLVFSVTDDKLIILEKEGRKRTYKKKKN